MNLKTIFEKIEFAKRYRAICDNHTEFDNRLRGQKNAIYKQVLGKLGYEYKYFSNGSFYQVKQVIDPGFVLQFHLVLKDGQIESLLYIKKDDIDFEGLGRLDFIPQKLDISFERKEVNLPLYTSEKELEVVLKELFSIYEDLKIALVEHLESA